jgi:Fe-S cluster biogenesis protein NfuA
MTEDEKMGIINAVIEEFRPVLQRDGGDIAVVALDGDRLRVKLSGACTTCSMAAQTLGGIRRRLMTVLDSPILVVPANG